MRFLCVLDLVLIAICQASIVDKYEKISKFSENLIWPYRDNLIRDVTVAAQNDLVGSQCKQSVGQLVDAIKSKQRWAYSFLDATGRIKPGFLKSETTSLGAYLQCLNSVSPDRKIKGRLFLVRTHWPLVPHGSPFNMADIPVKNSSWLGDVMKFHQHWYLEPMLSATCLPSSCSAQDIENIYRNRKSGAKVDLTSVVEQNDEIKHNKTALLFWVTIGLVALSTLASIWSRFASCPQWLRKFDAIENTNELFTVSTNADLNRFNYLNGVRMLYNVGNFLSHFMYNFGFVGWAMYATYGNYTLKQSPIEKSLAATLSVFVGINFVMGGLVSVLSNKSKKSNPPSFFSFIRKRIFRFLPIYAYIVLVNYGAPAMPGPTSDMVRSRSVSNCHKNWYWEFTFLTSDILNFEDQCNTDGWYLGTDLRINIAGYFILWPLLNDSVWSMVILASSIPLAVLYQAKVMLDNPNLMTVVAATTMDLKKWEQSAIMFHGRTFNYVSSYAIGLLLGYVFLKKYTLKSATVYRFLWITSTALMLLSCFLPLLINEDNRLHHVYLGATLRTLISASFAVMCYLLWLDNSMWFAKFLSLRAFQVLVKLSYSTFMLHGYLIVYESYTRQDPLEYHLLALIMRWISTAVMAFVVGYFGYIVIESPFAKVTKNW
ncbi:hypothetical protein HDE_12533 [Halotydeus destructor]|nr:hypothetical protein HDE_12533 [Halotydeus destructor]